MGVEVAGYGGGRRGERETFLNIGFGLGFGPEKEKGKRAKGCWVLFIGLLINRVRLV